jgi:hypothetical protein
LSQALTLLERAHTILSDMFPHEGLRAIGGSRRFIGSPVLPLVRGCFGDVLAELVRLGPPQEAAFVVPLLTEAVRLVGRMERETSSGDEQAVNNAATLLYLASGLSWNYLRRVSARPAPHNTDYVRVESVPVLLGLCGRQAADEHSTKQEDLLGEIGAEIGRALRRRSWMWPLRRTSARP